MEASSKGGGTGPGHSRSGHSAWELGPLSRVIATSIVRSHDWFTRVPPVKDDRAQTEWMAPVGPE